MSSIDGTPPAMVEFACTFEAYRRLGFSADEVFCAFSRGHVFAVLQTQGKEFTVACGPLRGGAEKDAEALYQKLVKELPHWPDNEFRQAWEKSFIANHGVELIAGLQSKGIELPCARRGGR